MTLTPWRGIWWVSTEDGQRHATWFLDDGTNVFHCQALADQFDRVRGHETTDSLCPTCVTAAEKHGPIHEPPGQS